MLYLEGEVTAATINDLIDWIRERLIVDVGPGLELRRSIGGSIIALDEQVYSPSGARGWFWGQIREARVEQVDEDGVPIMWTYPFVQVERPRAGGYDVPWQEVEGGRSGTAYNTLEILNGHAASEAYGNGVRKRTLKDVFPGFRLQPCPVGAIVVIYTVVCANGETEYWFSYANGLDGACE
jgi:hypothetical protein